MAAASITNPLYKANLVKADGTKYQLKDITTDLIVSHAKDELAEKVNITIVNVKSGSQRLHNIIALMDKVYVYANTGSGYSEIFRGIVWEREFSVDNGGNEIKLTCYDKLIYLHNSKDNVFFKKGKKTKDVITSIAKKWGFKISYKYKSISHGKLVYHNQSIADIIVDILEKTKKSTGTGYVIRFEKNVMIIEPTASNSTIYHVTSKENAIGTNYRQSMDGMITKVQIVKAETITKDDKEEETGKYLTVANVKKNTAKYGTFQDIIVKGKDDKLADAKKEANQILSEHASPESEFEVKAVDNPLIKKGHKIYIAAGTFKNYYNVLGIEHDATKQTMYLEVKKSG